MDFDTGRQSEGSQGGPQNSGAGSSGGYGGGSGGAPPRAPSSASGADFDYRNLGPSFVATAREIVLNPVGFFRGVRKQGDFLNPLIFAVICALISGILGGIIGFLINLIAGNGIGSAFAGLLGSIFLLPIGTAIFLFIWAAVYYLLVILLIKPNSGYEATFRVVAYASVVQLVSWLSAIPILGILVSIATSVYLVVLSVLGIREVHSATTGRAALVVLIPVAVLIILGIVIGAVLVAILAAAFSQ